MNSLGDDPSDDELKQLQEQYSIDGKMTFDAFSNLMLARLTDNDTEDAIVESWKVIAGDKEWVTEHDMMAAGMEEEKINYLKENMPKKEDGYDYVAWTKTAYQ